MMENLSPVESLVSEIKGNTRFLEKIFFRKFTFITILVVSGVLIAGKFLFG